MQENHVALAHAKDYPRNPIAIEVAPYFPQAMPEWSTMWTPGWPAKFDFLGVLPNRAAVVGTQFQDPFPDRIAARLADINLAGSFLARSIIPTN
jgi:hypothetical protein